MKKIIFSLLFAAALMTSCSKSSGPAFVPDCSGAVKSFSADVMPIFQSSCNGCHNNFSNYTDIVSDKSAIRSKIVDGSMPKKSSLTSDQKNSIICWIDNGTPNN
jgi:hypothetical protein